MAQNSCFHFGKINKNKILMTKKRTPMQQSIKDLKAISSKEVNATQSIIKIKIIQQHRSKL